MEKKQIKKDIAETTHCRSCGHELVKIVRTAGPKVLTLNFSHICTNPKCCFFVNSKNLHGWRLFKKDKFDEKFNQRNWPKGVRPGKSMVKRDWKDPPRISFWRSKISSEF